MATEDKAANKATAAKGKIKKATGKAIGNEQMEAVPPLPSRLAQVAAVTAARTASRHNAGHRQRALHPRIDKGDPSRLPINRRQPHHRAGVQQIDASPAGHRRAACRVGAPCRSGEHSLRQMPHPQHPGHLTSPPTRFRVTSYP